MKEPHKILMLGWEFPPKISGGLGVASQGLAEALAQAGHEITFLLPKKSPKQVSQKVKLVDASRLKPDVSFWKKKKVSTQALTEVAIGTRLMPYLEPETFHVARKTQKEVTTLEDTRESELLEKIQLTGNYDSELSAELIKYAMLAVQVARKQKPDTIHAHDWITFRAATMIRKILGLPIVLHVHSTEYDRNGLHAQAFVIAEEQHGFDNCDHILCVSEKLRHTISSQYGINPKKITVAPNAIKLSGTKTPANRKPKTVAFIGRLTEQKSPATFIDLARDLTSRGHDFKYLIIGEGHLRSSLEEKVRTSNFSDRMTFTGFLERTLLLKELHHADLLVMPSASEPFGLVALEAIMKKIPVAAATGAGICEFVPSLPQVDRWDQYSFIQLIEKLMTDDAYRQQVVENCHREAQKLTWQQTVKKVEKVYLNVS